MEECIPAQDSALSSILDQNLVSIKLYDNFNLEKAQSIKITKKDRSLSPLNPNDERRKRRLAAITNKDWALSEIYHFVRAKFEITEDGEPIPQENVEENFK